MGLVYSAAAYRYVTVSGGVTNLNTQIRAAFRIRDLTYNATPRNLAAVAGMNPAMTTLPNSISFRNIPYAGFKVYAFDSAEEMDPANAVGVGIVPDMPLANDFTSLSNNTYNGWIVFSLERILNPTTGERLPAGGEYWIRVQAIDVMQKPVSGAEPAVFWGGDSPVSTQFAKVDSYPEIPYPIVIDPNITNGAVIASEEYAAGGTVITLTVMPAAGYRLVSGSLQLNGVPISGYSFVMPRGFAIITAQFSRIPSPPGATPAPPPTDIQIGDTRVPLSTQDAMAYELYKLGLMRGVSTDEQGNPNFGLDQPLTRLQALILTIRLLGLEEEALAYEGENPFTDVTAASQVRYVAFAFDKGITTGVSATLFRPTRLVTMREFTTFLLRVLGYDDSKGDFEYVDALAKAIEIVMFTEKMVEDMNEGVFIRSKAVDTMIAALLTYINNSDEIKLIDTLVEAEIFTREQADAFIEAVTGIDEEEPEETP